MNAIIVDSCHALTISQERCCKAVDQAAIKDQTTTQTQEDWFVQQGDYARAYTKTTRTDNNQASSEYAGGLW